MTLVEVLVGIGIVGFMGLVFAQMMSNQNKQMQRLDTKASVLEAQNLIVTTLQDSTICSKQFSDPALGALKNIGALSGLVNLSAAGTDANNPLKEKISLNKVLLGSDASSAVAIEVGKPIPGSGSVAIKEIYISDFVKKSVTDDTKYVADLFAVFDEKLGPLKPLKVRLSISTNTSALTQRGIQDCNAGLASSGGGSGGGTMEDQVPSTMAGVCAQKISFPNGSPVTYQNPHLVVAPAVTVNGSNSWSTKSCACLSGWQKVLVSDSPSYGAGVGAALFSTGGGGIRVYSCIKE